MDDDDDFSATAIGRRSARCSAFYALFSVLYAQIRKRMRLSIISFQRISFAPRRTHVEE